MKLVKQKDVWELHTSSSSFDGKQSSDNENLFALLCGGVKTINSYFYCEARVTSLCKCLFISSTIDEEDVLLKPCTKGEKARPIMLRGWEMNILICTKELLLTRGVITHIL